MRIQTNTKATKNSLRTRPLQRQTLRQEASKTYRGRGKEVVLVGTGGEVTCVGNERQRFSLLQKGKITGDALVSLGVRLGLFTVKEGGVVFDVQNKTSHLMEDATAMAALENRWADHIYRHTGIRQLTKENIGWDPNNFAYWDHNKDKAVVSRSHLPTLALLGVHYAVVKPDAQTPGAKPPVADDFVEIEFTRHDQRNFRFEVTFGGPLPTGWGSRYSTQLFSRMAAKDIKRSNYTILMAIEAVCRAALSAGFHPELNLLSESLAPKSLGLFLGTGIGPEHDHRVLVLKSSDGSTARPFDLAHMLGNIPQGYISPLLGIEGIHATHTGACESALGSIADAYRTLKFSDETGIRAAFAGGYETALTPDSINGFTGNTALLTNRDLLKNLARMVEEPAFAAYRERIVTALEAVNNSGNILDLPKEITELASRAYDKYRDGFILAEGAGVGLFMTLDEALERNLPIIGFVAGVGAKKPDSKTSSQGITALGDGLGEAYREAFLAAVNNYADLEDADGRKLIEKIGFCIGHGTSTQMNGFGERREIHRINAAFDRDAARPILITGDKSELGHRVGGNFPMLFSYLLEHGIPPSKNYIFPGREPTKTGEGALLDELFPTTRIVGEAGEGGGKHVPLTQDYGLVTGLGFGGINTAIVLKRFSIDDLDLSPAEKLQYAQKSAELRQRVASLQREVDLGLKPLF